MTKLLFLLLSITTINNIFAQVPLVFQSLSSEPVYISTNTSRKYVDRNEAVPRVRSYWANSKVAYNFVGDKELIENILVDANILFNAITFSPKFYLPIMGNITQPNSDLVIDSFKQNIESILLQNDGLNLGIYPSYTMDPDFNLDTAVKTNLSLTLIGKVRINGLQDSTNSNVDKLYTSEIGFNGLFQFRGFDLSKSSSADISIQVSYQSILNTARTFSEKFQGFTNNGKKSWFVFNTYLIIPVFKDGLGLSFNFKIAEKTTGIFTAGFIYSKGL